MTYSVHISSVGETCVLDALDAQDAMTVALEEVSQAPASARPMTVRVFDHANRMVLSFLCCEGAQAITRH